MVVVPSVLTARLVLPDPALTLTKGLTGGHLDVVRYIDQFQKEELVVRRDGIFDQYYSLIIQKAKQQIIEKLRNSKKSIQWIS